MRIRRLPANGKSGAGMPMGSRPKCSLFVEWVCHACHCSSLLPFSYHTLLTTILRVTIGSFLPLTLESLARERGIFPSSHLPCVGPGSPAESNGTPSAIRRGEGEEQCVVGLLGLEINTASFAMYTFSLAVLVQALTLISFSALADYGWYQ